MVVAGVGMGLLMAAGVLWSRAHRDVATFLGGGGARNPIVVYSAPMEVREGMAASVEGLADDLLAAGYEKVEGLDGPQQFRVEGSRVDVWTAPMEGPGFRVAGGRASIVVRNGRVTDTGEADVVLRPVSLATVGDLTQARTPVVLAEISPWIAPAVLAMEDQRFREHIGIDPWGVLRALTHNVRSDDGLQGGSTITQQLAKNLFLSSDRTIQRKVREAFFATALESELDKDEILEIYLGEVYLGHGNGVPIHGVEQAARAFFGTSASRLTLSEAATIGGMISSPNSVSPLRHPERAKERRDLTLRNMVELGWVTEEEAARARAEEIVVDGVIPAASRRAPWAVDAALEALESELGPESAGWKVHTHVQPLLQQAAEDAVAEGMAELDAQYPKAAGAQVALVAVRVEDGAVVAMVGGRDYVQSPFNRATRAWRHPGSTVKPLVLLAAFDADPTLHPLSRVVDEPIARKQPEGEMWEPRNYDGLYHGEMSLRRAIEHSRNIPAVKLAEKVGLQDMQTFFEEAGLARATAFHSAALGAFAATPLDLAGAYTVFPGGGTVSWPWLVQGAVETQTGEIVQHGAARSPLASARATAMATAVLRGVLTDGTGARAWRYGLRGPAGGKTGTTDDFRDAWFVGFTPELVVAVWVGRDQNEPIGLSGSRAALPTWARFLAAVGPPRGRFPRPEGMTTATVCAESHQIARPSCEHTYTELFTAGHVPSTRCELHGLPVLELSRILGGLFGGGHRGEEEPIAPEEDRALGRP